MTVVALALCIASWMVWTANLVAVLLIKFRDRENLYPLTRLAFFASTFACVAVTVSVVWLDNGGLE